MNEESLFEQAVSLAPERVPEFLTSACGDDLELRERVEALLAAHNSPDSIFDAPAITQAAESIPDQRLPKRLGDFEIVKQIGHGGMGVVFEAKQLSLNRRVALKVLSSGLGLTAKAVMRFRREAEAAAKLHHTNIVPIYATAEDRGVHFYAMEQIEGPSLDCVIQSMKQSRDPVSPPSNSPNIATCPEWVNTLLALPASPGEKARNDGSSLFHFHDDQILRRCGSNDCGCRRRSWARSRPGCNPPRR